MGTPEMTAVRGEIRDAVESLLPAAGDLLGELIQFPSTPGDEKEAMAFFEKKLSSLEGTVERVFFPPDFTRDPEYSFPIPGLSYDGRYNLRFVREGRQPGRTLLINAHMDVVPPSQGMDTPWEGKQKDGTVFGRGACDDKGPLVAVFLALKALDRLAPDMPGRVIFHTVNEEENGGNGTLAMIRRGEEADGCVVMEPSSGNLYTSVRGAVWFKIRFYGTAGHSGQAGQTRSALMMAHKAISALETYHRNLLDQSRLFPLFNRYSNPMPLTFGRLSAGNWPAAAPNEAVLEGVLGFLPNKTRDEICGEFEQVLLEKVGLKPTDFELEFTYRHDCSVVDPESDLPSAVMTASENAGVPLEVSAFPASCDAWFYPHFLSIPAVVFGPGDLKFAHSRDEQIEMSDISGSAQLLVHAILQFCKPVKATGDR
ncbi:MAG: M20/M25/M40 family metallo-hydrolase [Balneolaceae bacterium]